MERHIFLLLVWVGFSTAGVGAQRLTIDQIMEGEDFVGVSPSRVRWSGDSRHLYFQWRAPGEKKEGTYLINSDGSGLRRLSEEEEKTAWPPGGIWDRGYQRLLYSFEGDLFLYHADGTRRQLTRTQESESNPRFTLDEKRIYFTRANNLFLLSLEEGSLVQVTDFRSGSPPSEKEPTASQKFLTAQQEKLFEEFSGRKKEEKEEQERKRKEKDARAFYIKRGQSVSNLQLSPDEKYVLFRLAAEAEKSKSTVVPSYVTENGYTEDLPSRTKVGDLQSEQRLGIYEVETGKVRWVEGEDFKFRSFDYAWNDQGTRCALLAISEDHKERRILALEVATGETRVIDHLRDEAWIDGPGSTTFGWMPEGERVYFISEKDGWAHLYAVRYDGSEMRQLTQGAWEVTSVQLSRPKTSWYLTSSEVHPGERHFYRMPLEGGTRTRLTFLEGRNDVVLSPDEKQLAILHSSATTPAQLYWQPSQPGAPARQLMVSTSQAFRAYPWTVPELVQIPARDGARPYGRFYRPKRPAPGKPAVIFVHGAGYLQNAHKWWSSYYREYMFHHFLMEQGYHVLDIDYRGSAGYGRDWRTGIYRHMGGKDFFDQVDGARWLVQEHGVDPKRIGIYGGSYGGFITLMAMFTEPDVFAAGAALRPVTDWAHYNHPYTSRILNLPQGDAEAYQRSSPIYFAEGLKGALLICHGMVDTNVHFQDTVRLAQRLIELRKENWEVAIYPVENHAFQNATSWADEYKRIFKLFDRTLKQPWEGQP